VAQAARQPSLPRDLVESIAGEKVLEPIAALGASERRLTRIEAIDLHPSGVEAMEVGVKRITLVAVDHEPPALGAAEWVEVFITTAVEAVEVEVGFVDDAPP
jgi:hypothetical protein